MRIAYHHRTRGMLAEGVHIRAMIEAFQRLGCEVDLLSLTTQAPGATVLGAQTERSRTSRIAYAVIEAILPVVYNVPGALYLTYQLILRRYEFLYERYATYNLCGWIASRLARVPLVLEVNSPYAHQTAEYSDSLMPWLARRCERFLLHRADQVLTVSRTQRDYLVSLGARPERIHVISNGVDFDRFDHRKGGDEVRHKLGLKNEKVIGFIGGLRLHHGIDIVLKALAELGHDAPTFLVVGEGKDRDAIETAIRQLGLDRVILTGGIPHEDVPHHIAAMDIAVKPTSNFYCCPLKLFEYMAMKVPVIAGYSPSVAEVLEDGITGRIIETEPEAFRDAIRDLLRDPGAGVSMAEEALRSIQGRSWIANAEEVLQIMGRGDGHVHGDRTP